MRTVVLSQLQRPRSDFSLSSGPGAPIFQPGPQTRIYRAPVRAVAAARAEGHPEAWGQVLDISLLDAAGGDGSTRPLGDEARRRPAGCGRAGGIVRDPETTQVACATLRTTPRAPTPPRSTSANFSRCFSATAAHIDRLQVPARGTA